MSSAACSSFPSAPGGGPLCVFAAAKPDARCAVLRPETKTAARAASAVASTDAIVPVAVVDCGKLANLKAAYDLVCSALLGPIPVPTSRVAPSSSPGVGAEPPTDSQLRATTTTEFDADVARICDAVAFRANPRRYLAETEPPSLARSFLAASLVDIGRARLQLCHYYPHCCLPSRSGAVDGDGECCGVLHPFIL